MHNCSTKRAGCPGNQQISQSCGAGGRRRFAMQPLPCCGARLLALPPWLPRAPPLISFLGVHPTVRSVDVILFWVIRSFSQFFLP
mmetsp:Transcript_50082/g.107339  ORF Transcript_50082/g.107339 Transcript_50082/m.107339 type:complete len:85 (-) Transcript_50082:331-585(-)